MFLFAGLPSCMPRTDRRSFGNKFTSSKPVCRQSATDCRDAPFQVRDGSPHHPDWCPRHRLLNILRFPMTRISGEKENRLRAANGERSVFPQLDGARRVKTAAYGGQTDAAQLQWKRTQEPATKLPSPVLHGWPEPAAEPRWGCVQWPLLARKTVCKNEKNCDKKTPDLLIIFYEYC